MQHMLIWLLALSHFFFGQFVLKIKIKKSEKDHKIWGKFCGFLVMFRSMLSLEQDLKVEKDFNYLIET